jgi:ribosomal protein S18 acetylase RimI-like enzyme
MNSMRFSVLPQKLLELGLNLRPEEDGDAAFLLSLYLSVRWPELDGTNWPDAAKYNFLSSQFQIQTRQYRDHYSGMERWIVNSPAGPVGRLYLLLAEAEWRVVEFSLMPEWRNRGVGTALLEELGKNADAAGKPLRLHVAQDNPALHLYLRLGFEVRTTDSLYWMLERVMNRAGKQ